MLMQMAAGIQRGPFGSIQFKDIGATVLLHLPRQKPFLGSWYRVTDYHELRLLCPAKLHEFAMVECRQHAITGLLQGLFADLTQMRVARRDYYSHFPWFARHAINLSFLNRNVLAPKSYAPRTIVASVIRHVELWWLVYNLVRSCGQTSQAPVSHVTMR